MFGWLSRIFSRARASASAHTVAREDRPEWLDDEQFMAWQKATKPGEYDLVMQWPWDDPTRERPHAESIMASVRKRMNWRWEGWQLGLREIRVEQVKIPQEGPGYWWDNPDFVKAHDEHYELEEWGTKRQTAMGVAMYSRDFWAENPHCTAKQVENLNYEATKALRRRWQGWCGVLQMVTGRVVCPQCGSWDVDNVGDGETALCNGQKHEYALCKNEWKPSWPTST